jgi:hypothetical protein
MRHRERDDPQFRVAQYLWRPWRSEAQRLALICDDPIIAESACKHGVTDEDILHAYANPIRVFDLDEGFTMVIGANLAAIIYAIGVVD